MKTSSNLSFLTKLIWIGIMTFLPLLSLGQSNIPHVNWISQHGRDNGTEGLGVEWSWEINQTSDGGYISCGFTNLIKGLNTNPNSANSIPAMMKLGPHGELLWEEYFDEGDPTRSGRLTQVLEDNNSYVAVGEKRFQGGPGGVQDKILLVRTDLNGQNQFTKQISFPASYGTAGASIKKVPSGGYIVAGLINPFNMNSNVEDWDMLVLKVDDNFNEEWHVAFDGGGFQDRAHSITTTYSQGISPDGTPLGVHDGYVVVGHKSMEKEQVICADSLPVPGSFATRVNRDIWIIRLDLNGNILWEKDIDSNSFPASWYTFSEPGECSPMSPASPLYKTSTDEGRSVIQDSDGDIVLTGIFNKVLIQYVQNDPNDPTDITWPCISPRGTHGEYLSGDVGIFILDKATGDIRMDKNIAHFSGDDWIPQVRETHDKAYVVVGTSSYQPNFISHINNLQQPMLIKVEVDKTPEPHQGTIAWRRTVGWSESGGMCGFGVGVANDGGYAMCGNNNVENENWQFVKLYSDCQPNVPNMQAGEIISGFKLYDTPRVISDEILIQSGGTLRIENTSIEFADVRQLNDFEDLANEAPGIKKPRIRVMPGGTLEVINSTLKGLSSCNRSNMWEGIQAEGISNSGSNGQAKLILRGSLIQDAIMGVRVNKGTYNHNGHPSSYFPPKGGAILQAEYTSFKNCRRGIHFTIYPYSAQNPSQTESFIRDCEFETTSELADPDYVSVDTDDLAGVFHGQRLGVNAHLTLWGIHGVDILGNTFSNDLAGLPYQLRGLGIGSIDASYRLTKGCTPLPTCSGPISKFENLYKGVESLNYGGMNAIEIDRSVFDKCYKGVQLHGIDFANITRNTFLVPPAANLPDDHTFGVWLNECTGYQLAGNFFDSPGNGRFGSIIENTDVGNNDFANEVYSNTYRNLNVASNALGQNRGNDPSLGLEFICNNYDKNAYDIAVTEGPGISEHQGSPASSADLAGNLFDGCTTPEGEIYNVGERITYFHHNNPDRTPDPNCVTTSTVDLQGTAFTFNADTDCIWEEDQIGPGGDTERMERIGNLDLQILQLESRLSGNTRRDQPILDELYRVKRSRQLEITSLIRSYLHDPDLDGKLAKVRRALEWEESEGAKAQLIAVLMQSGESTLAATQLAELSRNPDWKEFVELHQLILAQQLDGRTLFDLKQDPGIQRQLERLAADQTHGASIHARAALKWVEGIEIAEEFHLPQGRRQRQAAGNLQLETLEEKKYLIHVYPNPTSGRALLETHAEFPATVQVIDILGRKLEEHPIEAGKNSLRLNANSWKPGIYLIQMTVNGKTVATSKIVIR